MNRRKHDLHRDLDALHRHLRDVGESWDLQDVLQDLLANDADTTETFDALVCFDCVPVMHILRTHCGLDDEWLAIYGRTT